MKITKHAFETYKKKYIISLRPETLKCVFTLSHGMTAYVCK